MPCRLVITPALPVNCGIDLEFNLQKKGMQGIQRLPGGVCNGCADADQAPFAIEQDSAAVARINCSAFFWIFLFFVLCLVLFSRKLHIPGGANDLTGGVSDGGLKAHKAPLVILQNTCLSCHTLF